MPPPTTETRPLRICFVAYRGNMECGGQGVYLWFLARELARQGHSVEVFVGPPYPDPMPWAEAVHRIPNREMWAKWFTRDYAGMLGEKRATDVLLPLNLYELAASRIGFLPEPFAFSCRAFRALAQRLRDGARWDIVHDVQCLGYGLLGLRALGLPTVTTVHHPLTVDRRASFGRDETLTDAIGSAQFYPIGMQSFVARRLDRVLTSSETSARQIVDDFGVKPQNVVNVWNGLDTDYFCPDPAVKKSEAELVCVGRASDPNKGIRTLVESLALLPPGVKLTLIDNDHPENEIFKWAANAGVTERLDVVGRVPRDELLHLYRRATLVVVPSRFEGFGLPAAEAMACGTPVVACASGALPEVMRLGGGGVLVPRDDRHALAEGIRELLADPERRATLGTRARSRVVEAFSWKEVARTTAGVYRDVLTECRGRPTNTITSARRGQARPTASNA
jgi:glycosyltransferase involved in cell wall biosynthesis